MNHAETYSFLGFIANQIEPSEATSLDNFKKQMGKMKIQIDSDSKNSKSDIEDAKSEMLKAKDEMIKAREELEKAKSELDKNKSKSNSKTQKT